MGTRDDHHALHTLRVRIAAAEQSGDQTTADRLFAQALPIARRIRAERARTLTRATTVP